MWKNFVEKVWRLARAKNRLNNGAVEYPKWLPELHNCMGYTPRLKESPRTTLRHWTHMPSHTTAAVLQYVELYSILVIPAVEHANEAV